MRKILTALCLGATTLYAAPNMAASTINLNLSSDSARFVLEVPKKKMKYRQANYEAGLLYNDQSDAVAHLGVNVRGKTGELSPGLNAGIGARLYLGDTRSKNLLAIGIGAQAAYRLRQFSQRLELFGKAYYAPSITSFSDTDSMYELNVGIGYEVIRDTVIYLGHRTIRAKFKGSSRVDVDRNGHIGVRFVF